MSPALPLSLSFEAVATKDAHPLIVAFRKNPHRTVEPGDRYMP
jgi:hypothetical protein